MTRKERAAEYVRGIAWEAMLAHVPWFEDLHFKDAQAVQARVVANWHGTVNRPDVIQFVKDWFAEHGMEILAEYPYLAVPAEEGTA